MKFLRNAGYDDEYVKRKKVGKDSPSTKSNAWRFERDGESEWMGLVIYYQQAWEFAQNHQRLGERRDGQLERKL